MLVVAVLGLGWTLARLSDPTITPHDDYISSWAAGYLNVRGMNPYDPELVLAVQRTVGWKEKIPYRIWYPPWVMPLLAPFGLLPYAVGRFLWFILHIGALVLSADLVWRYYGGEPRWRGIVWLVVFTFWPAVIDVRTGQISALILLGLAGFLHCEARGLWFAAGACLPLVAIKPPVLYLLWIALPLWVVAERRWGVLVGVAAAGLALSGIAVVCNPSVVAQFLHMALHEAPQPFVSTVGTILRLVSRTVWYRDLFSLQFVPSVVGFLWFVAYWRRQAEWRWREQASTLAFASVLTSSYAWIYDHVVLLPPVLQVAVSLFDRSRRRGSDILIGYVAIQVAVAAMNVADVDPFWYVWVPFALLAWYSISRVRVPARDMFVVSRA